MSLYSNISIGGPEVALKGWREVLRNTFEKCRLENERKIVSSITLIAIR